MQLRYHHLNLTGIFKEKKGAEILQIIWEIKLSLAQTPSYSLYLMEVLFDTKHENVQKWFSSSESGDRFTELLILGLQLIAKDLLLPKNEEN